MFFLLKKFKEFQIRKLKRFVPFKTTYPGFLCYAADKSSFLFMYDEVFNKEIYKFKNSSENPRIIDCGANIGLPIAYWLKHFPHAKITAFEPDPEIYKLLQKNIKTWTSNNSIELIEAGVTAKGGDLKFYSDGADGGSIHSPVIKNSQNEVTIKTVTLTDFIKEPIDFLKIDIEGAEYGVLDSVADNLNLVRNIFVEYHSFVNEEQHLDDILSILKKAGFRYYIEHIGVRSAYPYIKQESYHGMDLQINIFGFRNQT